ncbi:MAG: hypothetical protein K6A70_02790 [Erysipelotrichaceae bacterium]|nr:hypothetical protein [Erysipelotrichaceae bacterium]
MKILKKLLGFFAAVLILGGLIVLGFEYIRNKTTFNILFNNSVVKGTLPVLKNMGISLIAVIIGLLILSLYFRVGGAVRRKERERRQALKEQQRESEELKEQLRKEAEEARNELEQARSEAEEAKKETELMRMTFVRKNDEAPAETNEEQAQ